MVIFNYKFSFVFIFYYLAVITDAPNLSASHLIHVNSPTWNAGSQAECISELDKATINILTLADQEGLTSVALPSISSGKYVKIYKIMK
jgi:O-acetyl-ADP-ribose deacetylase (regulator of RNase III)